MPAETKLFLCLKDNYGVLIHDPATGATAAIDAPEAAPVEAALKATGWKLTDILVTHHHADHTGGIAELKKQIQMPRGRAEGRGRQNSDGRRDRARGRHGQVGKLVGQRDRDARPHARPHHLLVSRRQARLRRRHAVLDRLRPRHRGHAGDDVGVAEEAARSAGRHAGLLRPRIHAGQHQVRADHRAGQRGAEGARRARRRSRSPTANGPSRPRSTRRRRPTRSCAPTCRRSPPQSGSPASPPPRCSPRSGRGRISSEGADYPSRARRRSRPRSSPRCGCRHR